MNPRITRRRANAAIGSALVLGATSSTAVAASWGVGAPRRIDDYAAALDRAEPGWDLVSRIRAVNAAAVPDAGNAAITVRAAGKLFLEVGSLPAWPTRHPPGRRFSRPVATSADALLAKAAPGFAALDSVLACRRAAMAVDSAAEPTQAALSVEFAPAHAVSQYARWAAARAAEAGDRAAAARHARAAAALPRWLGPQLSGLGEIVRFATLIAAATAVERVLARVALVERDLAGLQGEFDGFYSVNSAERMLLAERAYLFAYCVQEMKASADPRAARPNQLRLLESDAALIEASRQTLGDQWSAAQAALATHPMEGRRPLVTAALRARGHAGLAVAAIACERYRLRHGRWPDRLADLPADRLAEVPLDPFTGRAVAYERAPDGARLAIESPDKPVAFRLYDPAARSRP